MRPFRKRIVGLLATLVAGGTCLQIGGCSVIDVGKFIASINPCGTILACDGRQFDFLMSGIDEPGVHPATDPFCVWPPYCSPDVDPIFGGLAPP